MPAWIYLHFVIDEIRSGKRDTLDLEGLPNGLFQYYAQYWKQWREKDEQLWDGLVLPMMASLAAAQEPVALKTMMAWTGIEAKVPSLDRLLNTDLRPFVISASVRDVRQYRLGHASLAEFFSGQVNREELDLSEVQFANELMSATNEAHGKITSYYLSRWGGLGRALETFERLTDLDETDFYGIRYMAAHLELAGRHEELHHLLAISNLRIERTFKWNDGLLGLLARALRLRSNCNPSPAGVVSRAVA